MTAPTPRWPHRRQHPDRDPRACVPASIASAPACSSTGRSGSSWPSSGLLAMLYVGQPRRRPGRATRRPGRAPHRDRRGHRHRPEGRRLDRALLRRDPGAHATDHPPGREHDRGHAPDPADDRVAARRVLDPRLAAARQRGRPVRADRDATSRASTRAWPHRHRPRGQQEQAAGQRRLADRARRAARRRSPTTCGPGSSRTRSTTSGIVMTVLASSCSSRGRPCPPVGALLFGCGSAASWPPPDAARTRSARGRAAALTGPRGSRPCRGRRRRAASTTSPGRGPAPAWYGSRATVGRKRSWRMSDTPALMSPPT